LAVAVLVGLLMLAAAAYGCWMFWDRKIPGTLGKWLLVIGLTAGILVLARWVLTKWVRYRNSLPQAVASLAACLVGWIILPIHLRWIEPRYMRFGPKYRP
jgi:hypothetical protein